MTTTTTRPAPVAPSATRAERKVGDFRRTVRLFRQFKGGSKVYVGAIALLVFESLTAIAEPYPIAYLVDFLQNAQPSLRTTLGLPAFLSSERTETFVVLTIGIVLIAAINSAADSFAEVCMARGGRAFGYNVRVAMYSHLQRLSLAYHDKKRTGDVLTRVTGDVLVLEDFIIGSVSNILGSGLVLIGTFGVLLYQSWNVALVALVVVPLLAVISTYFSRRIKAASKTQRSREGELASTAQEMLTSIRLIQSYGRGRVDLRRFSDQTAQSMRASLRTANVQAKFSFVIALAEALAICAVVWIGVFLLDRRALTIGTLVLLILLLQNMFKPARKIVSEWYKIGKVFASVERIADLLDREEGVRDEPDATAAPPLKGRLTFRRVSFSYPAEHADGSPAEERAAVLRAVDFEVSPGEIVALVGQSGAGKSTIAQLVPRLYDPTDGAVLVDGLDVRSLTLSSVRRQVSLVLQDTVLLSGTVAENIGYGVENATPERIEAAARAANAHEFIERLPDGYDTMLAERGTTLSGGQRQRLAIARAFIRETPILILDEPTTGLDAESTQQVLEALRSLMRGRTTLIISHDPELIRCADRTLVIAGGTVAERGDRGEQGERSEQGERDRRRTGRHRRQPAKERSDAGTHGYQSSELASPLRSRLPGLSFAVDPERAGQEIERRMLAGDATARLEDVRVEKLWYHPDGTCSLRYAVRLGGTDGGTDGGDRARPEHTVLARVHPDDEAAAAYLAERVGPLAALDGAGGADGAGRNGRGRFGGLWRQQGVVVPGTGLALHPFPLDPALVTLPLAVDPAVVAKALRDHLPDAHGRAKDEWTVHVVHHPREGGCVLRFDGGPRRAGGSGIPSTDSGVTVFGKVYGDGRGQITAATLQALAAPPVRATSANGDLRVPRLVGYVPDLRLLFTGVVPGEPLLRAGSWAWSAGRAEPAAHGVLDMMTAAGRLLAELHRRRVLRLRPYSRADELGALAGEADRIEPVWPDLAERARQRLALLHERARSVAESWRVLCHGDFTPAQILASAGGLALVDFDTVCRAEPALDLGRFLAHLQLAGVKAGGTEAWPLLDELSGAFLRAYAEASTPWAELDRPLLDRVALYRDASLLRTALHGCRQLKDARMKLALAMLDDTDDWTRRIRS
ncbi:ABC transporter transmembrane domain-containing protein [Actinopolymorpha alba]|uniref:ABC transporter transmembrane domain-containing protein n=1 Tax=Actinopolymorpha alba TaxID=533267 RepID=UPI0003742766|nr:ABC transporter transmembrane domain-containing protein [Actinopolymorpha alba]